MISFSVITDAIEEYEENERALSPEEGLNDSEITDSWLKKLLGIQDGSDTIESNFAY